MNFPGSFLCIGPTIEPCTVWIDPARQSFLDDQLRIASKHGKPELRHAAYRRAFGVDAHYAIPCTNRDAMTAIATGYTGEHQERVRQLAACIATGTPYGHDDAKGDSKRPPNGGRKAKLTPDAPAPKRPGGAAQELLFGSARA